MFNKGGLTEEKQIIEHTRLGPLRFPPPDDISPGPFSSCILCTRSQKHEGNPVWRRVHPSGVADDAPVVCVTEGCDSSPSVFCGFVWRKLKIIEYFGLDRHSLLTCLWPGGIASAFLHTCILLVEVWDLLSVT